MVSGTRPPELYVATNLAVYFIVDGEIMACRVDSSGKPIWDDTFTSVPADEDKIRMVDILEFLNQQAIIEREARERVRLVWPKD